MRIAYFINQYPKVSHSFIRREIQALERLGCDITRIALRSDPHELVDERDKQELAKTRFVLKQSAFVIVKAFLLCLISKPGRLFSALYLAIKTGWKSERGVLRHIAYFVEACVVSMWLANLEIDHVHAHFGTNSTTVAMIASELSGIPYSFTVHGPEEFDKPVALSLGEKIKRSAFVVAISSFGKSQLLRWVDHGQWAKVKIVHCGLDEAFHSGNVPALKDVARLVCVGRLCEQKGQLLLIEAAGALARQGLDFELVFAGDGPLRTKIEELVAHYDLGTRVAITGWISNEDVRAQITGARALVLPSFAEGLPVVIMEAMALKRPVISTYVAGIPELVRPGKTGWLVPPGDAELLQQAIRQVLTQPVKNLHVMGDKARQRVLKRHDIDHEAAKLMSWFRDSSATGLN